MARPPAFAFACGCLLALLQLRAIDAQYMQVTLYSSPGCANPFLTNTLPTPATASASDYGCQTVDPTSVPTPGNVPGCQLQLPAVSSIQVTNVSSLSSNLTAGIPSPVFTVTTYSDSNCFNQMGLGYLARSAAPSCNPSSVCHPNGQGQWGKVTTTSAGTTSAALSLLLLSVCSLTFALVL